MRHCIDHNNFRNTFERPGQLGRGVCMCLAGLACAIVGVLAACFEAFEISRDNGRHACRLFDPETLQRSTIALSTIRNDIVGLKQPDLIDGDGPQ